MSWLRSESRRRACGRLRPRCSSARSLGPRQTSSHSRWLYNSRHISTRRLFPLYRPLRADEAGGLDHTLNRRCSCANLLQGYRLLKPSSRFWQMVLRPTRDGEMSRYLCWITDHTQDAFPRSLSHVGRRACLRGAKSFPIQDDNRFLTVCRYVERNALRAGLVTQAQAWRWGSLWRLLQSTEPEPGLLLRGQSRNCRAGCRR